MKLCVLADDVNRLREEYYCAVNYNCAQIVFEGDDAYYAHY